MRITLGSQNLGVAAISLSALSLTITGLQGFDLHYPNLATVYNSTRSAGLPLINNISSSTRTVSGSTGLETQVFTFKSFPAGFANGDAVVVELDVPLVYAQYFTQVYQASKV